MSNDNKIHCSLKMNETTFQLFLEPLKKYHNKKELQFVDSYAKIDNVFVHLKSSFAIFEYQDILEIRELIDLFLLGACDNTKVLTFVEPDLAFVFPELDFDVEPYVELRLFPYLDGFTAEFYSMELDKNRLIQLRYFLDYCLNAEENHKTWYTASDRPISYHFFSQSQQENEELKKKLDELFEACLHSWDKISTYPPCLEDTSFQLSIDPTYG